VRLEEGQVEKWYGKANVSGPAEMDSDTIGKCIAYMRARVAPTEPAGPVVYPPPAGAPRVRRKVNGAGNSGYAAAAPDPAPEHAGA